ncbi:MAG: hypothetical protein ABIR33_13760 [Pyrinomonadaceae bacterium]
MSTLIKNVDSSTKLVNGGRKTLIANYAKITPDQKPSDVTKSSTS